MFEWGYNDRPFTFRSSPNDRFYVKFEKIRRKPENFYKEMLLCAEKIYNKYDNIHILLSGGLDSEIVIRSFVDQKLRVIPTIIRFPRGINKHDISFAFDFCSTHNLKPLIIDFDPIQFYKTKESFFYIDNSQCAIPAFPILCKIIEMINGTVIIGSGEPEMAINPANNKLSVRDVEHEYSISKFAYKMGYDNVISLFFQYTTELVYSSYMNPVLKQITSKEKFISTVDYKYDFYSHYFKNLTPRKKYNGYENINKWYYDQYEKNAKKLGYLYDNIYHTQVLYTEINDFLGELK